MILLQNDTIVDVNEFKRDIFGIDNRNFSEKYAERMIEGLLGLKRPTTDSYDLVDPKGLRYEIKGGRVMRQRVAPQDTNFDRAMTFDEALKTRFTVQIQHLKKPERDSLCYVLFFQDTIKVFGMTNEEFAENAGIVAYCPTQTRGCIPDLDGQFSINHRNLLLHVNRFLKKTLDYSECSIIWNSVKERK